MSLAAETRRSVEEHPFLVAALRAGVVNYTAAARYLEVDGEPDAVATALRRYAEALPDYDRESRDVRVRMESGIGPVGLDDAGEAGNDGGNSGDGSGADALVTVGGTSFGPGGSGGDRTAIVATGAVDAAALAAVLGRLTLEDLEPSAAAVGEGTLLVVVDRREGPNALRAIESALEAVPTE